MQEKKIDKEAVREHIEAEQERQRQSLLEGWRTEEQIAHMKGWDFSHIHGRYEEEDDLPWDYRTIVQQHLTPDSRILDIDTGGGEFLLSLKHPYEKISATEAWPPNIQLCQETLLPLGIDFRAADGNGVLPFENDTFDLVINRHGDFCPEEIYRVLKPEGVFITQQVGAENDRELVEVLLGPGQELPFSEQYLKVTEEKFKDSGFLILDGRETFSAIRFFDVGALVWFARIIEWEFPGFSVERYLEQLFQAQEMLEKTGVIEGRTHRFLLVAKKTKNE